MFENTNELLQKIPLGEDSFLEFKISGRKPLYEEVGEAVKLTIFGRPNPNRPQTNNK